jgi:8-oxo-dGTP pyrophosphatase MutT (NUDIX family)
MATRSIPEPGSLIRILQGFSPREHSVAGYTRAAVLVPLTWTGGDYELILTKRTDGVETHKGQVAFPGGMRDEIDMTAVETALRETEEEIGIPRSAVQVAGTLDDIVIPTGFVVTPVVGLVERVPKLVANPAEVVEVFRVPLSFFAGEGNGRVERRSLRGREYEVWHYSSSGHLIWGATAAIIRALLTTLRVTNPQTQSPGE